MVENYNYYKTSSDYILGQIDSPPEIGIILGSALGKIADSVKNKVIIDYSQIPNFLLSTVKSHAGKLIIGEISGKKVALMSGRFHYYEGYSFSQLAVPIRVMGLLGIKTVILTNAAGAINTSFNVGDIMIITDHIKLCESNPMRGANIDEFGDRFFDVSDMYTKSLREKALSVAESLGQKDTTRQGVYFFASGPSFETPAEIKAMRILGGDAVGMSTVTEALTAAHMGIDVLGLSLMSNMAAGVLPQPLTTQEVSDAGKAASGRFSRLIENIVEDL